jgi:hypothetical protein
MQPLGVMAGACSEIRARTTNPKVIELVEMIERAELEARRLVAKVTTS